MDLYDDLPASSITKSKKRTSEEPSTPSTEPLVVKKPKISLEMSLNRILSSLRKPLKAKKASLLGIHLLQNALSIENAELFWTSFSTKCVVIPIGCEVAYGALITVGVNIFEK